MQLPINFTLDSVRKILLRGWEDQLVVSIGRLTAFYVVLVPMELIPSKPPLYAYIIVSFCTLQKGSTF